MIRPRFERTWQMKNAIQYDESKLTELILYIGAKCGLDKHYGALKLNKILFYSDFLAFKERGRPITGAEYRKYPHGPAPACMKPLKEKLEQRQDVFEYHNPLPSLNSDGEHMIEKRLLPRRAPKMDKFCAEEIAIVDSVIERLRPMTGTQISQKSHRHPGWKLSEMEEQIPYFCAHLSEDAPVPLSATDMKKAQEIAGRYLSGDTQLQAAQ